MKTMKLQQNEEKKGIRKISWENENTGFDRKPNGVRAL